MESLNILGSSQKTQARDISMFALGIFWSILLVGVGLIYKTYSISVQPDGLEVSRQIGLPFMIAQLAFIVVATRNGFSIESAWRAFSTPIKILVGIFLATFWISSVFMSEIPVFSTAMSIGTVIHLIFAMAICQTLGVVNSGTLDRFGQAMVAGLAIFAGVTAQHFLFHPAPDTLPGGAITWQFSVPGFISVRLFGAVCGAVLAYLMAICIQAENERRAAPWHYAALTFVLALALWTGTRAAFAGAIGALVFVMPAYRQRISLPFIGKFAACVPIATLAAYLCIPDNDPVFFYLFGSENHGTAEAVTSGRISLWKATWDAFLTVPLLGAGAGSNHWMMPPDIFPHVQPHNVILQFLLNWGAIAAISALMLLAIATWKAHQMVWQRRELIPVLAMLDALLIMALVDGTLYFSRETMMVMICFAIIFKVGDETTPQQRAA